MKIQSFTVKGIKKEDMDLPKEFEEKINLPLLAQAVYVYEERSHVGLRKTKTRSEVNRTSKKVYKQKGTGGARHGSRRAPIFVGGGVALGPRPVRRILNLSAGIRNKAKLIAFALKAKEKQMVFVSGLSDLAKTKDAGSLVKALEKETSAKRFTFVLSDKSKLATRSLKNLSNASSTFYKDSSALDVYRGGMIVLDEDAFVSQVKTVKKVPAVKKTVKKAEKKSK